MKSWKRWLFYLMLNAWVAACATWATLSLWARAHPCPQTALWPAPGAQTSPARPQGPTPTAASPAFVYVVQAGDTLEALARRFQVAPEELRALNGLEGKELSLGQALLIPGTPPPDLTPPGDPQALRVAQVLGGGHLEEERVILRYDGPGVLSLAGWTLDDGRGHTFVFPALALQEGGAVQVWTKGGGVNTAVELFWGLEQAVWLPGTTLTLRDATGEVVLAYPLP